MRLRFGFILIAALAATSIPFSTASARRLKVGNGRGDFPTIQEAIDNARADDVIQLRSNSTYEENVQMFPPVAAHTLTITGGPNTRIDGGGLGCVLQIDKRYTLELSDVVITHGKCARGGGVANSGILFLNKVTVTANEAAQGGGGIFNDTIGTLDMKSSLVTANQSTDPTAGAGGGILNLGGGTVIASTISNNIATVQGGGIENRGNLLLYQVTISDNSTPGNGGGIDNFTDGQRAPFTALKKTLVRKNTAASGGGVFSGVGKISLQNSIIRDNTPDNCAPASAVAACAASSRRR